LFQFSFVTLFLRNFFSQADEIATSLDCKECRIIHRRCEGRHLYVLSISD